MNTAKSTTSHKPDKIGPNCEIHFFRSLCPNDPEVPIRLLQREEPVTKSQSDSDELDIIIIAVCFNPPVTRAGTTVCITLLYPQIHTLLSAPRVCVRGA